MSLSLEVADLATVSGIASQIGWTPVNQQMWIIASRVG